MIILHDAPLHFSLSPVPVCQCHLIGRNIFMFIDKNYIEFSISIWRNVPVVNTKLCRLKVVLTLLHQWTDIKDEWNILWHCTNILLYIKILTTDWQIKGIRYTELGLATFWGGGHYFREVATFGGPLLSGFTSVHEKLTLFSGGRYYRNFTVS